MSKCASCTLGGCILSSLIMTFSVPFISNVSGQLPLFVKGIYSYLCIPMAYFAFFLLLSFSINSSLQLFDGHNGSAAAIYAKENLLNNVLSAIPPDLNSDEWVSALPRAMVAGFVKTDKDFQERGVAIFEPVNPHNLHLT